MHVYVIFKHCSGLRVGLVTRTKLAPLVPYHMAPWYDTILYYCTLPYGTMVPYHTMLGWCIVNYIAMLVAQWPSRRDRCAMVPAGLNILAKTVVVTSARYLDKMLL